MSKDQNKTAHASFIYDKTESDFSSNYRLPLIASMAVVAGCFGTVSAWMLQKLISFVTNFAYFHRFSAQNVLITDHGLGWPSVLVPVAGCLVIGLMARFGSEKIRGHGIPEAIEAILLGKSRIQPKVAFLKPLSSAISIGTGGPFGAEGPIIMTAGALGSIFAQMFRLTASERKTLLVAGAAAGMSATFNSPIAAILLAVELLLFEWKPRSFIPVSVASLVAAALRPFLMPAGALFPIPPIPPMPVYALLVCALIGLFSGLLSGGLTQMVYRCEDFFEKLPIHWMWWPALGGLAVGFGGLVDPHALGVGYDNIAALLQGTMVGHAALMLLLMKSVIWAIALGSGTSGGVLAPLLMIGGALGALLAPYIPFGDSSFWALMAMAAVMSGTMRAPLTATVFALELTHNIDAMLPLMVACVIAQGTTVLLLKRSILTEKIARRGQQVFREYAVDPFELVRVEDIMVKAVDKFSDEMTVDAVVEFFSQKSPEIQHRYYPVVNGAGQPVCIVSRADALRWVVQGYAPETLLKEYLSKESIVVGDTREFVGRLADRMIKADVNCAVILNKPDKTLAGMITRGDLLRARAGTMTYENVRETLISFGRSKKKARHAAGS
jgi:H+/Cl- antiporter ClcA/CBS domain-containing protein